MKNKNKFLINHYHFYLFLFLFMYNISARSKISDRLINVNELIVASVVDSIQTFKGYGNLDLSFEGEHLRGRITVLLNKNGHFTVNIYSLFGHEIASIASGADSAFIIVGGRQQKISIHDSLSIIPFFSKYPFIFSDFVRILTGRLVDIGCFQLKSVSYEQKRRKFFVEWECDSFKIIIHISGRKGKIRSVTYSDKVTDNWKLHYKSIKAGICKEIYFESYGKNYFSIEFESQTFGK